MPKGRRRELFRLQGHALSHVFGLCNDHLPRQHAWDVEWAEIVCPMCLHWFPLDDLDEDHAPQKKHQSRVGEDPHLLVLTCRKRCNQHAGGTFESSAFLDRQDAALQPAACAIHQRWWTSPTGILVAPDQHSFALTDLKTAYLVAFATLGYRWALSRKLAKIRKALQAEDLSIASGSYELLCAHGIDVFAPRQVIEVTAPFNAILVTGDHGIVLLPVDSSPDIIAGSIAQPSGAHDLPGMRVQDYLINVTVGRRFDWPAQFALPGGDADRTWEDGQLFHYDRCSSPHDHVGFAIPREVDTPMLQTHRTTPRPATV